jgi:hypothetical protein
MEFMYGLRRMMGLTSPQEDADYAQRERVTAQEAMRSPERVQPGTAIQESFSTRDAAMQELQRQGAPQVAPVSAPVVPPAVQPAPAPYGSEAGGAMDALKGYGVRSTINPRLPTWRPEDDVPRRPLPAGVRG